MKTTENFGDSEISLELEPFVKPDFNKVGGNFNVSIDIELEDGSIMPELIQGSWFVDAEKRYIFIKGLQKPNTILGNLQRRLARLNNLRLVDEKLILKTWESLPTKEKSTVKIK